jgi:hypothetical protein
VIQPKLKNSHDTTPPKYPHFILAFCFLAACSGIKHLPPGEKLYTGADVKLEDNENLKKRKTVY